MKPTLASKETCTGCMACIDSCPTDALFSVLKEDGHLYVDCNDSLCISCGKCEKVCPIVSDFVYQKENNTSTPYAAWADDNIREKSASGGVFAAIAYKTMGDGGYVVGAIMDGFEVKHIITNNKEDIVRMQGSKYQHGNMQSMYKAVKSKLKEELPVLFSGLPCQVGGLYSFLGKQSAENLLTIDIACGGVPSILPLQSYLSTHKEVLSVESFRDKNEGWRPAKFKYALKTKNKEGVIVREKNNFVTNAFSSSFTNRYSCFDCKFSGTQRKADLTIADFWGLKDFKEQYNKGVSLVIAHSTKGLESLQNSKLILHKAKWIDILPFNPRISVSQSLSKYDFGRAFLGWNFRNLSTGSLNIIYGGGGGIKSLCFIPLKVFRLIMLKANRRMINKQIEKELNILK